MRILLDESLPPRLRSAFPGHEVTTVADAGWSGLKNGDLLQVAAGRFDLFVTADQNIQYQQNLRSVPLSIAVLAARDNRFETLLPLAAQLMARIASLPPQSVVRFEG